MSVSVVALPRNHFCYNSLTVPDSALNAGPEEEANWLPAPTLLTLADEVIE